MAANTYSTLTALFTATANAIRGKTGSAAAIKADDFPSAIGAIPTGTDVSDTTAVAGDVLDGKDFYLANGTKATGSIPSQAAQTIYPSTSDQTIAAGKYLSGAQTVKAVVCNLTQADADKIVTGATLKIGDADDDDRVLSIVGTGAGAIESTETVTDGECAVPNNALVFPSDHIASRTLIETGQRDIPLLPALSHWYGAEINADFQQGTAKARVRSFVESSGEMTLDQAYDIDMTLTSQSGGTFTMQQVAAADVDGQMSFLVGQSGGGSSVRTETVQGTLANPWGNIDVASLKTALGDGKAIAVLAFGSSGNLVCVDQSLSFLRCQLLFNRMYAYLSATYSTSDYSLASAKYIYFRGDNEIQDGDTVTANIQTVDSSTACTLTVTRWD